VPIIPIRGLSQNGILKDPSAYDIPLNAWSDGRNVRFGDAKAGRAPAFRGIQTLTNSPAFAYARRPSTGFDTVFVTATDGTTQQYVTGSLTDVTPAGFSPIVAASRFTGTYLGDVTYLNRNTAVPQFFGPTSTQFANLPNWDSTWRCVSLRAFHSFLIALNVTKGGVAYPTMVKWSDLTLAGQPPGSWDSTDSTKSAGENVLAELDSPIVDGAPLGDTFMIYADNQVWQMLPVASTEVFQFRRLFSHGGAIAQNCIAEVDGKQYVFGPDDIYVTDGQSTQSLVEEKNRRFIYNSINVSAAKQSFVHYAPNLREVWFCYQAFGSSLPLGSGGSGCNFAAVYNLSRGQMSFMDLPNVTAITQGNVNGIMTWDSSGSGGYTWDTTGGSWDDQTDSQARHIVAVSQTLPGFITANRLGAYDFVDKGRLSFPVIPECNAPAFLERTGIDLDDQGTDLGMAKLVRRIFPQVDVYRDVPVTVQVGSSYTPTGKITWGPVSTFDPNTQYKVDCLRSGRYLALRLGVDSMADFEVTGIDLDVVLNGER
jgi:hypothetical protein